jgi:transcriptional regulator of acetoin/glycerol metabolism
VSERFYKKINALEVAANEARKATLYRTIAATNGDLAKAAQNLGVHRTYIYALLKRYGIAIERKLVPKK